MEQAQKRYMAGFTLSFKSGQQVFSPVNSADDEEAGKEIGDELLRNIRAMPRELSALLDLMGISGVGVSVIGIPRADARVILPPASGLIIPR